MDPFWNNIYDDAKDRRYGTLFMATLFLGLPLVALGLVAASEIFAKLMDVLAGDSDLGTFQVVCLVLLADLAVMAIALFWRHWVRAGHRARRDRLKYSNLSRDELLKARSKLKRQTRPVKFRPVERPARRLARRAPDFDLKY